MRRFTTRDLTFAAVVAAMYAGLTLGLTYTLPILPQYQGVQLRVAEALTVLPFLFPAATPGLVIGCFLANLLGSPIAADWVLGPLATLLACLWTQRMPNRFLATLPPVICNVVIVGAELALFLPMDGMGFWMSYAVNALTVGLGEVIACCVLGSLLLAALPRIPYLNRFIPSERVQLAGRPA